MFDNPSHKVGRKIYYEFDMEYQSLAIPKVVRFEQDEAAEPSGEEERSHTDVTSSRSSKSHTDLMSRGDGSRRISPTA